MAGKVAFELVSPERLLVSTEADMVVVPGGDGDFGVLPGHIPMISTVRPGVIEIRNGGQVSQRLLVAGGFAEVTQTRCTVLADEAVPLSDINVAGLDQRLRAAQTALSEATTPAAREAAQASIETAQALQRAFAHYSSR